MTKYIIELEDDIKYLIINGRTDNRCYTLVRPVAELEILNSDYINEHYGELQDDAYKRGLEDGKWKAEDGCDGCKYYEDTSLTNPCSECSRGHVDRYEPLSDPDRIEVGDEVIAPCGKAIVTTFKNDLVFYLYSVGNYGCTEPENLTKTGRHFDIASILEAMRQ
mgnify:CR=1 FL=1